MKMMVASYNNGATDWNAEAEETAFRSHALDHSFSGPARCTIVLADPDGSILRKYNADANDVYLGVGKVTIEDPTATDLFYGRIVRVVGDFAERTVKLECRDWLDQLDEEVITYDMREALDDDGLRQSEIKSDVGDETEPVSQTALSAKALDGAAYTTETTAANDRTANDMTLLPAVPAVNDAYLFGFDEKTDRVLINIGTAGVGTWTITWEFYGVDEDGHACGVADWYALAGVTDGTSGFTVAGESVVSWTLPDTGLWISCTIDSLAKYWIRARVSAYTAITTQPLGTQAWHPQTLYDDDMTFGSDEWNGKYLVFPTEASGTQQIRVGPYADTVVGTETAGSYADTWLDDANFHDLTRSGASLTVDYDFHINLELGTLYASGPSAGWIYLSYICYNDTQDAFMRVKVKSAAEVYYTILQVDNTTSTTGIRRANIEIPAQYLAGFADTLGEVTIEIEAECAAGPANVYLDVYYCSIALTYEAYGTSSAYLITDTTANEIITEANLTYNGLGCFEGMKYCVAKQIYLHLEAATGPILGGDDVVTLTCGVGNVENTTGVSTRQYKNRTRSEIVRDLAVQDGAVFFIALGGSTVTYQKTFGAATATLTDSTVDSWQSLFDYSTLVNDALVYGVRIGDIEVFQQSQSASSIAKYRATRSKVLNSTGIVSNIDAKSIADTIVAKDYDVLQMVQATVSGLDTTHRLGTVVEITSSYLWSTAAKDYVVTRWAYDSKTHKSYLTLHPVSSVGFMPIVTIDKEQDVIKSATKEAKVDTYIPLPVSNEVV